MSSEKLPDYILVYVPCKKLREFLLLDANCGGANEAINGAPLGIEDPFEKTKEQKTFSYANVMNYW